MQQICIFANVKFNAVSASCCYKVVILSFPYSNALALSMLNTCLLCLLLTWHNVLYSAS